MPAKRAGTRTSWAPGTGSRRCSSPTTSFPPPPPHTTRPRPRGRGGAPRGAGGCGAVGDPAGGGRRRPGVHAGERPRVPAERALPGEPLDRLDGAAHVVPLLVAGHLRDLGPAPAVGEHVVARLGDPLGDGRVAFQGPPARANGDRHPVPVEEPGEPPDPGAGTELEVGLGPEVPDVRADLIGVLAPSVVTAVPVGQRVLAAGLVVDRDVDHEAGLAGPPHRRSVPPVADEVPYRTTPGIPLSVQPCHGSLCSRARFVQYRDAVLRQHREPTKRSSSRGGPSAPGALAAAWATEHPRSEGLSLRARGRLPGGVTHDVRLAERFPLSVARARSPADGDPGSPQRIC